MARATGSSRAGPGAGNRPNNPPLDPVGPQAPPTRGPTPAARRARRPARRALLWTAGTSYRRGPWCIFAPPHRYIFTPLLTSQERIADEQTLGHFRYATASSAQRRRVREVCRRLSVSERSNCRWRREHAGPIPVQAEPQHLQGKPVDPRQSRPPMVMARTIRLAGRYDHYGYCQRAPTQTSMPSCSDK